MTYCCCCCVYSRMIRAPKTRAGCAALLGLYVRARVDQQLAVVWLRRGTATAFAHRGCIHSPTHRSLLMLLCVPRTAAVPRSAQLGFLLPMPFFDSRIRWAESSGFGPKSDDLGYRILKSDFVPSAFAISGCIRRPIISSDRKMKN